MEVGAGPGAGSVPFLMYHGLESEAEPYGNSDPGELVYVLSAETFERHMRFLREGGYSTATIAEILDWQAGARTLPDRTVVITFDDGHRSNFSLAMPILLRHGFRAEFFLTTGFLGREGFLRPEEARKLLEHGMSIGSHSVSHPMMNDLPEEEIRRELAESRRVLEDLGGREVAAFSAPNGRVSDGMARLAASAGYRALCTSRPGVNRLDTSPMSFRRIPIRRRQEDLTDELLRTGTPSFGERTARGALDMGKRLLGNRLYDVMRGKLLSVTGRMRGGG